MPAIRKAAGAGMLEAMIAVLMISILGAILLDRLLLYQEIAERTAMETTAINLRSALRLTVAELRMQNKTQDLGKLVDANPIEWLDTPPSNYVGELSSPTASAIPPGSWCFDRISRQLIYRPNRTRLFKAGADGDTLIRFRVTAFVRPRGSNGTPGVEGVALSLVRPYDWSIQ